MELMKFTILPAAIALSLMIAPVALAGVDEAPGDTKVHHGGGQNGGHHKNGGGQNGGHNKTPTPSPRPPNMGVGGGNSQRETTLCRLDNRVFYTHSLRECRDLEYRFGFRKRPYVSVQERVAIEGRDELRGPYLGRQRAVSYGGTVDVGGYGYYQPQRVIRYYNPASPAASKQAKKRARKAARLAAQAYANGYGQGAMIGYGNGVMVGGYGNHVVVNGDVYAGQQVVVRKKRKGKKARRIYVQQPQYYVDPGLVYGGGYEYDGSVMVKGGGY